MVFKLWHCCSLPCAGMQTVGHGWRISLAIAGGPAIVLFIGSILLPESPNSLVER